MLTRAEPPPALAEEPESRPARAPNDEPEPVEYVFRTVTGPDGEVREQMLPATLDVLLNLKFGDRVCESKVHYRTLSSLEDRLRRRLERAPDVGVFADLLILWRRPELRDIGPDVYVVKGLRDRDAVGDSFDVAEQGAIPCLVFEVVSRPKDSREKDEVHNLAVFEAAGVKEHVLVYPPGATSGVERFRLRVRRLGRGRSYREVRADASGRFHLRTVGLYLSVEPDGHGLRLEDVATGERLRTAGEEQARAEQERARAEQEQVRADQAESRADQAESRAGQAESRAEQAEAEARALRAELERLRRSND